MTDAESLLAAAERVADLAAQAGHPTLVIGAAALAGHGYGRLTEPLDLAVSASLDELRAFARRLEQEGFTVTLREPDAEDPLGGVLDVRGAFGLIQVVNYGERFPVVIDDALREADLVVRAGSPLRLVPLPHLVALKLYAGGRKSQLDILELLDANPEEDLDAISALCDRYRLTGFKALVRSR